MDVLGGFLIELWSWAPGLAGGPRLLAWPARTRAGAALLLLPCAPAQREGPAVARAERAGTAETPPAARTRGAAMSSSIIIINIMHMYHKSIIKADDIRLYAGYFKYSLIYR